MNHLVTRSGCWQAGKRNTEELIKLAERYEMRGNTCVKLSFWIYELYLHNSNN